MNLNSTRRKIKRILTKNEYKNKELVREFYLINKTITEREEIKAVKNKIWATFIDKMEKIRYHQKMFGKEFRLLKQWK
jgi:hypothetical protein